MDRSSIVSGLWWNGVAALSLAGMPGLALTILVVAVLLGIVPTLWSRLRGRMRKEVVSMNSEVLAVTASVGSDFLVGVAATAVPG